MIGRLSGILVEKQAPDLLLEVNGVSYELQAPMSTFYKLPECGARASLHTHLVVREDAHLLYGFIDMAGRQLFRALIRVNGVGPKLALTILSGIDVDEFVACVHEEDTAALIKLPGVGRKTAERLLVEMRDRLKDWAPSEPLGESIAQSAQLSSDGRRRKRDAQSALEALGYKPAEAARVIDDVDGDNIDSSEELIRLALRTMVK